MQQYDIAIVGGGMVGSTLACALSSSNLSIAVIEKAEPKPFSIEQPMDLRVSAISAASADLLKAVNAWDAVLAMRSCPYRYLETWEGPTSNLLFDSQQMGHPQLGHIIENRLIQLALWQQMQTHSNIELLCGATISQITRVENGHQLSIGDDVVHCKLLIGADGANSMVRSASNIGVTSWDYAQHAMLINITTELPQQDITWQQFYPSGPRALLPLSENNASLVWYDSPSRIKALSQLPLSQLKNEIVEHFPNRLGEFDVDNAGAFPLTRRHAQQYVKDHLCILGDAAHTINPLAGQGVNLGFKDVVALSSVICNAVSRDEPWWDKKVLQQYESKRRPDNLLMQSAMDVFYLTFSNDSSPLKLLRNTALKAAQRSAWGKKQVMKYAMGL
ncbi:MAG: FAD-dependent monooxygenase [Psychrobium sp.]